jgi:hypothetical protein
MNIRLFIINLCIFLGWVFSTAGAFLINLPTGLLFGGISLSTLGIIAIILESINRLSGR